MDIAWLKARMHQLQKGNNNRRGVLEVHVGPGWAVKFSETLIFPCGPICRNKV